MERPKYKAINFDLDTIIMRERNVYPSGYGWLYESFVELGFYHRQGSGYVSMKKMVSDEVSEVIRKIVDKHSWLIGCVKKMDVTDVGRQYDLLPLINLFANLKEEQAKKDKHDEQTEQVGQAEQVEQVELAQKVGQVGLVGQAENKIRRTFLTTRDEKVLARIRRSKEGTKFDMLYNGEIKGEKADVQLMFALAFFTKSDRSQMERIYKSSALYDPSKSDVCIKKTISIAIDNLNKKTPPQKPSSKKRDNGK